MARSIEIEDTITVGTLAEKLMLPVTRLIGELMKNGVMVTVNERIDFDTAQIIVSELGLDVSLDKKTASETPIVREKKDSSYGSSRPPVVAVMGHVDHGKTSLLDAIRGAQVAKGEAGGITQHISAYQITHDGRRITFLDTPGHEAFAAIREHGAHLTDIAIIVVAADDGVKPQTIEAIRFARNAGARIIVALNKIDKEGADANRVKQQLSENNLLPEEWGGDTVIVEVSAKTKLGIDGLLDMILLVADVEDYRAETDNRPADGLIIESHLEHGRGPIANALIEEGTLRRGEFIVAGAAYAKIRTLEDTNGKSIEQAGPSTPVIITGFKTLPEFGDEFIVVKNEKIAREQSSQHTSRTATNSSVGMSSAELLRMINRSNELQELNVILRADVQGSLTSVTSSIKALETEEVAVKLVSSGVGAITENDVHLAATANAVVYGFNVVASTDIKRLAARDKVKIRLYNVIYELLDDVKADLSKLLAPKIVENEVGSLQVKAIFKTTKSEIICGGEVTKGKLVAPSRAYVIREGDRIAEVEITNLKRGPQDAKEVLEGEMCGVELRPSPKLVIQEGDGLEFFTRETVERSL
jgi:translation initiation factor IF-2